MSRLIWAWEEVTVQVDVVRCRRCRTIGTGVRIGIAGVTLELCREEFSGLEPCVLRNEPWIDSKSQGLVLKVLRSQNDE